jgi:hypothetical protein
VDFLLHSSLSVARGAVGVERQPVVIVDNVLQAPAAMIDFAAREVDFESAWTPAGGYPGVRASAPIGYVSNLVRALSPMIEEVFALGSSKPGRVDCYLSMVTMAPHELKPLQRIPHIDTVDPLRIAVLHYFCDEQFGGTAFFRHRATGASPPLSSCCARSGPDCCLREALRPAASAHRAARVRRE